MAEFTKEQKADLDRIHYRRLHEIASHLTEEEQHIFALHIPSIVLEAELSRRADMSYKLLSDINAEIMNADTSTLENCVKSIKAIKDILKVD